MGWSDFELDSALERDLLRRALPLVPTASDGSSTVTIDMVDDRAKVGLHVTNTLGPTPSNCIELLQIRPLLVGAAWKVLDLLLETALDEAGTQRDQGSRYSIDFKVSQARVHTGRPNQVDAEVWEALMDTYASTAELRHSLVHRRAHTDSAGALLGVDRKGGALPPLNATEQEAFVRVALRAAEAVMSPAVDSRAEADLLWQLGTLSGVHGHQLPTISIPDSVPQVTVIVDRNTESRGSYELDVPAVRKRQPFQDARYADLIVQFRDRPGQDLRGRLEDAPNEVVMINPDNPPDWLS